MESPQRPSAVKSIYFNKLNIDGPFTYFSSMRRLEVTWIIALNKDYLILITILSYRDISGQWIVGFVRCNFNFICILTDTLKIAFTRLVRDVLTGGMVVKQITTRIGSTNGWLAYNFPRHLEVAHANVSKTSEIVRMQV